MSKQSLLDLIDEKIAEAKAAAERGDKLKPKPATRAAINKANAQNSTGPKSKEGKAAASQNSLKHGFFANIDRLDPADTDFRLGLHPDGPIEDLCCREIKRAQGRCGNAAAQLRCAEEANENVETKPATPKSMYLKDEFNEDIILDYNIDSRDLAQAFTAAGEALDRVHKIETHLRRFYNRTFDRLQRMQRDRLKNPPSTPSDRPPKRPRPDHFDDVFRDSSERTQSSPTPSNETGTQNQATTNAIPSPAQASAWPVNSDAEEFNGQLAGLAMLILERV